MCNSNKSLPITPDATSRSISTVNEAGSSNMNPAECNNTDNSPISPDVPMLDVSENDNLGRRLQVYNNERLMSRNNTITPTITSSSSEISYISIPSTSTGNINALNPNNPFIPRNFTDNVSALNPNNPFLPSTSTGIVSTLNPNNPFLPSTSTGNVRALNPNNPPPVDPKHSETLLSVETNPEVEHTVPVTISSSEAMTLPLSVVLSLINSPAGRGFAMDENCVYIEVESLQDDSDSASDDTLTVSSDEENSPRQVFEYIDSEGPHEYYVQSIDDGQYYQIVEDYETHYMTDESESSNTNDQEDIVSMPRSQLRWLMQQSREQPVNPLNNEVIHPDEVRMQPDLENNNNMSIYNLIPTTSQEPRSPQQLFLRPGFFRACETRSVSTATENILDNSHVRAANDNRNQEGIAAAEAGPSTNSGSIRLNVVGICPICTESMHRKQVASTYCGHLFCIECINRAILINGKRCPTCRRLLPAPCFHPIYF